MILRTGMAVVGLVALVAAPASAQERSIRRSELPPAVEKTVATLAPSAGIRGFSEERENGQTFYEAEFVVDGRSRDVLMDAQGNVVEVEQQVDLDKLPPKVAAALRARAGRGRIVRVESLTKHEKLVAYEAHVSTKGRWSEIQVGPEGETLDHEE